MTFENHFEIVRRLLSQISPQKKLLFCIITCQNLIENYEAFQKVTGWGDLQILNKGLNTLRAFLKTGAINNDQIDEYLLEIDAVTPHTEDFDTLLVSFALDACVALESSFQYVLDYDDQYVLQVANSSYDTVDMFVQELIEGESHGRKLEKKIDSSAFMLKEQNRQINILKKLASSDVLNFDETFSKGQSVIDLTMLGIGKE